MTARLRPLVPAALALALLACGAKPADAPAEAPVAPTVPAAAPAASPAPGPDPAAGAPLAAVLAPYDTLQARLAEDAIAAVSEPAGALAAAAERVAAQASEASAKTLAELASAAKALAAMDKADADAVRKQFGEVSRAYVALLRAEPSLRAGRFLFHCPMAQGFTNWVQRTEELANPYMGSQMLECGSKREWE